MKNDNKNEIIITNWKTIFNSLIVSLKKYPLKRLCISDYPQFYEKIEFNSAIWLRDKTELFREIYIRLKSLLKLKGIPPWLGILPSDGKNMLSKINFVRDDFTLYKENFFKSAKVKRGTILDSILEKTHNTSMVQILTSSIILIDPELTVTSSRLILRLMSQIIKHSSNSLPSIEEINERIQISFDDWLSEINNEKINLKIFND